MILARFVISILLLIYPTMGFPTPLNATEHKILQWVDNHVDGSISLLEASVNTNSGTMNLAGVRAVGAVLRSEFDALGFTTQWIDFPPQTNRAGHLFARHTGGRGRKVLMIGHLDTVFEADDPFQLFVRSGNTATGPGIEDMKSGNIIMLYALKALDAVGALDGLQIVVAYTGDEEKPGEPLEAVRRDLVEAGQWADVVLGFEAAVHRDGRDWATVARRSSTEWRLEVSGKQAHSSGIFSEDTGAGAIFEVSRILTAFYREVRGEEYVTFNVGTIVGGTDVSYDEEQNRGVAFGKTNVVPRKVIVHGGLRTMSNEQLDRTRQAMQRVVDRHLPRTSAKISFVDGYPAMAPTEGNKQLQSLLSDINEQLGRGPMPALDPSQRGAADISFVAPYADGLAGLGAIGSDGHTPNEKIDLSSMSVAIKRAAILLHRLKQ
ncbi:MAG: M20/M25/M40 family metallo-hydrolase [Halieaceae bacterium]|jgi:glutamate carboxypeptidase|nr:M20/M25/M40 family metallo-hydrolase [Halieaceae bacterium]